MMERRHMLMGLFNTDNAAKLVHSHAIEEDYSTTLSPIYTAEIKPYVTFGSFHKLYICLFESDTPSASGYIDMVFFTGAAELSTLTSNYSAGGMIRSGYTNQRSLSLSTDAKCSAGTVIKIYELAV